MTCFLRLLAISFFVFSNFLLVGMEKIPTIKNFLRTEQEKKSEVIEFGDDKNKNLLSITSDSVYAIGGEETKSSLIKIFDIRYTKGDRITAGKIVYEDQYGGKIFPSDDCERIAVVPRFRIAPVEILDDNGSYYTHSFFLQSQYTKKVVFNTSGSLAAVIECGNEESMSAYALTLYTLPKKSVSQSPSTLGGWIMGFFNKPTTIEGKKIIQDSPRALEAVAFNNKNTTMAIGDGKEIYLYDLVLAQREKKAFYTDKNQITNIIFTSCDRYILVTAQDDGMIKMFDTVSGHHRVNFQGNTFAIQEMRIGLSFFGKIVATLGKNQQQKKSEVCLWDYDEILKIDEEMEKNIFKRISEGKFIDLVFE